MMFADGKILKGIGGFYYVQTCDGIIECRARGNFRNRSMVPCIGDNVKIELNEDSIGYVVEIYERKNQFIRPPISNIDLLLIVVAASDPMPDPVFIDKMLIIAAYHKVDACICFNKSDQSDDLTRKYITLYQKVGYTVFETCALQNDGIDELQNLFYGKTTAVCGFSGVGKSSLLNIVLKKEICEVGTVSKKLKRGKHTTRHVELIALDNATYLADTPGFSVLDLPEKLSKDDLKDYYPEFEEFQSQCKFADCIHLSDKCCAVSQAVKDGLISDIRYKNYINFYNLLKEKKEWQL